MNKRSRAVLVTPSVCCFIADHTQEFPKIKFIGSTSLLILQSLVLSTLHHSD